MKQLANFADNYSRSDSTFPLMEDELEIVNDLFSLMDCGGETNNPARILELTTN